MGKTLKRIDELVALLKLYEARARLEQRAVSLETMTRDLDRLEQRIASIDQQISEMESKRGDS